MNCFYHWSGNTGVAKQEPAPPVSGVQQLDQTLQRICSWLWHAFRIGGLGATAISGPLSSNTTLRMLCLASNGLTSEGVTTLADALRCNTSLQHLSLRNNGATTAACQVLPKHSLRKLTTCCGIRINVELMSPCLCFVSRLLP